MPEIDSAGVKNHHLEMKSTPPPFFARADFDPVGPFWGQLTAVSAADAASKPPQNTSKTPYAASNPQSASWGAGVLGTKISAYRASKSILGTKNL
jgi:hypothetical protein